MNKLTIANQVYVVISVAFLSTIITGCLSIEKSAYNIASQKGTKQAYTDFVNLYPQSTYTSKAQQQISKIDQLAKERIINDATLLAQAPRLQVLLDKQSEVAATMIADMLEENSAIKDEIRQKIINSGNISKKENVDWDFLMCGITVSFRAGKVSYVGVTPSDYGQGRPYSFVSTLDKQTTSRLRNTRGLPSGIEAGNYARARSYDMGRNVAMGYGNFFFGIGRPLKLK